MNCTFLVLFAEFPSGMRTRSNL